MVVTSDAVSGRLDDTLNGAGMPAPGESAQDPEAAMNMGEAADLIRLDLYINLIEVCDQDAIPEPVNAPPRQETNAGEALTDFLLWTQEAETTLSDANTLTSLITDELKTVDQLATDDPNRHTRLIAAIDTARTELIKLLGERLSVDSLTELGIAAWYEQCRATVELSDPRDLAGFDAAQAENTPPDKMTLGLVEEFAQEAARFMSDLRAVIAIADNASVNTQLHAMTSRARERQGVRRLRRGDNGTERFTAHSTEEELRDIGDENYQILQSITDQLGDEDLKSRIEVIVRRKAELDNLSKLFDGKYSEIASSLKAIETRNAATEQGYEALQQQIRQAILRQIASDTHRHITELCDGLPTPVKGFLGRMSDKSGSQASQIEVTSYAEHGISDGFTGITRLVEYQAHLEVQYARLRSKGSRFFPVALEQQLLDSRARIQAIDRLTAAAGCIWHLAINAPSSKTGRSRDERQMATRKFNGLLGRVMPGVGYDSELVEP